MLAPAPKSDGFAALPLSVPVVPLASFLPKENVEDGCVALAVVWVPLPKRPVPEEGVPEVAPPKRLEPPVGPAPKMGFAGVWVPVDDVF